MNLQNNKYFYAVNALAAGAAFEDARLATFSDRHRIVLPPPILSSSNDLLRDALASGAAGIVIEMVYGWANRQHLLLAKSALRNKLKVWFYWPREQAVEAIDAERLASHWRLWAMVKLTDFVQKSRQSAHHLGTRYAPKWVRPFLKSLLIRAKLLQSRLLSQSGAQQQQTAASDAGIDKRLANEYGNMMDRLIHQSTPVPFAFGQNAPDSDHRVQGVGVYLRTDYWAPIKTGGSYGHTCYVAKELAATTDRFVCFMANRFALLDEMGLKQNVMPTPNPTGDELSVIRANGPYYDLLSSQVAALKPAYIYERICLGNFVGARLSQELGIPYIVEYNGSEISMRRSFDTGEFEYEQFFLKAEEVAFKQATIISVISDAVREELLRRGISGEKILVNPNGVDLVAYAPAEESRRRLLRAELGCTETDRVIGFIGTFGGWHGIDVLAKALPQICHRCERTRFLLIGDGNFKYLIDDSIRKHGLENRIICTGRVAHARGAELLGACDVYVSPHSRHMVDSRFFGSPTKLFEYMAMGGGIVASDLEQIGEVLSPAIHAANLTEAFEITRERSILCTPGDVGEFVEAVVFLVEHPDIAAILGKNAREAAEQEFSWSNHVARVWQFAATPRAG